MVGFPAPIGPCQPDGPAGAIIPTAAIPGKEICGISKRFSGPGDNVSGHGRNGCSDGEYLGSQAREKVALRRNRAYAIMRFTSTSGVVYETDFPAEEPETVPCSRLYEEDVNESWHQDAEAPPAEGAEEADRLNITVHTGFTVSRGRDGD